MRKEVDDRRMCPTCGRIIPGEIVQRCFCDYCGKEINLQEHMLNVSVFDKGSHESTHKDYCCWIHLLEDMAIMDTENVDFISLPYLTEDAPAGQTTRDFWRAVCEY